MAHEARSHRRRRCRSFLLQILFPPGRIPGSQISPCWLCAWHAYCDTGQTRAHLVGDRQEDRKQRGRRRYYRDGTDGNLASSQALTMLHSRAMILLLSSLQHSRQRRRQWSQRSSSQLSCSSPKWPSYSIPSQARHGTDSAHVRYLQGCVAEGGMTASQRRPGHNTEDRRTGAQGRTDHGRHGASFPGTQNPSLPVSMEARHGVAPAAPDRHRPLQASGFQGDGTL